MASTMTRAALAPPAVASARRGTKARTTAASGAGGKSQKAVRWTLSRAGSKRGATASSSASSWPVSDASTAAAGATRDTRAVRRGASLVPAAVAEPPAAPAASSDSSEGKETFNWHLQWYPVAFTSDLVDDAPLAFTLLGQPLVFWKDSISGEYRCTADKCPHRLAPLSEGRINAKGEIECGYHGWSFDGADGKCTNIPQLPADAPALATALASPRSCVTPFPTAVAQGMLWVLPISTFDAPAPEDRPPLPLIPELENPDCVVQDIFRDLPMDYGTLLENVLDVSHVNFTHHNSVGKRENATPVVLEMVGALQQEGFTGIWKEGPRNGKYGSQYTEFSAPSLMRHTVITDTFTTVTVVYAVPTTPGRCRLMARFPFIFKSKLPRLFFKIVPQWYSHLSQNAILEDDQIFLHKQERLIEIEQKIKGLGYAQACYMPTKADVYVGAFRKWIKEMAGGSPAWPKGMEQRLPPAEVTRTALLDRFNSHTVNCKSCAVALSNLVKVRKVLRVASLVALAAAAAAFARQMPVFAVVGSAVLAAALAGVREFLGGLIGKMRVGPYPPPRRPPSMMEAALETARVSLM
uniref:Rieske domain-containing protein n=1 Tax=Mantoniella antarctica TaxID=81844 RepID=A0A7S0SML1_9CHLO